MRELSKNHELIKVIALLALVLVFIVVYSSFNEMDSFVEVCLVVVGSTVLSLLIIVFVAFGKFKEEKSKAKKSIRAMKTLRILFSMLISAVFISIIWVFMFLLSIVEGIDVVSAAKPIEWINLWGILTIICNEVFKAGEKKQ